MLERNVLRGDEDGAGKEEKGKKNWLRRKMCRRNRVEKTVQGSSAQAQGSVYDEDGSVDGTLYGKEDWVKMVE